MFISVLFQTLLQCVRSWFISVVTGLCRSPVLGQKMSLVQR